MKSLLERWSAEYDHVVVDTAPVLFVADTLPLAAKADAVVLVVRSGQSREKALSRMCDMLDRANAHVVGVIVNGVDLKLENYYLHPYRNYGHRGYRRDGNDIN
jgi:Mrp family chromosome partitioning ATPase